MQKWQYCALVGIAKYVRDISPYQPAVWYFTDQGIRIQDIKGDEGNDVARFIAWLGNEGWEMVGGVDFFERAPAKALAIGATDTGALLFKRPIE